jgi:hypothetical protein
MSGWIGVDLDGTLAEYDHWRGEAHIGVPVPAMVERVKKWLADGVEVRIFTARVHADGGDARDVTTVRRYIEMWCREHIGTLLPVTNVKDYGMVELWDDRAVQVVPNTGRRADGKDKPKMARKRRARAASPPTEPGTPAAKGPA